MAICWARCNSCCDVPRPSQEQRVAVVVVVVEARKAEMVAAELGEFFSPPFFMGGCRELLLLGGQAVCACVFFLGSRFPSRLLDRGASKGGQEAFRCDSRGDLMQRVAR